MSTLVSYASSLGQTLYGSEKGPKKFILDLGRPESYLFRSSNGLVVWSERATSCIMLDGECEARGLIGPDGEPALALSKVNERSTRIEYLLPAIDVVAITSKTDGAPACREVVLESKRGRVIH